MPSWKLADNGEHILWYTEPCEHSPQQLSVDGDIRFLEGNEAHVQGNFPNSSEFLQSVNDEKHVDCRARRAKSTLLLWEDPHCLAVVDEAYVTI